MLLAPARFDHDHCTPIYGSQSSYTILYRQAQTEGQQTIIWIVMTTWQLHFNKMVFALLSRADDLVVHEQWDQHSIKQQWAGTFKHKTSKVKSPVADLEAQARTKRVMGDTWHGAATSSRDEWLDVHPCASFCLSLQGVLEVLGVDKELHAKEYRYNTTKVKCRNSKSQKDNSLPQTCCPDGPRGSMPWKCAMNGTWLFWIDVSRKKICRWFCCHGLKKRNSPFCPCLSFLKIRYPWSQYQPFVCSRSLSSPKRRKALANTSTDLQNKRSLVFLDVCWLNKPQEGC